MNSRFGRRNQAVGLCLVWCLLGGCATVNAVVQGAGGSCEQTMVCAFDGKPDFVVKDDPGALREGALLAIEALKRHPTEANDRRLRGLLELLRTSRQIASVKEAVRAVAVSPNGAWLAFGAQDGYVGLIKLSTWEETKHWQRDGAVLAMTFSPNSRYLALGGEDRKAVIFDTQHLSQVTEVEHAGIVRTVAFQPGGLRLASAGDDHLAVISDISGVSSSRTVVPHENASVLCQDFSPDGKWVVTGAGDGTIRIFDEKTGASRKLFKQHKAVRQVKFSPNGAWIAAGSDDHSVSLLGLTPNSKGYQIPEGGTIKAIDFDQDGRWLAVTSADGTIQLIDVATRKDIVHLSEVPFVGAVAISPDGRWMGVVSGSTAKLIDTSTGSERGRVVHNGRVTSLSFTPDSRSLITAATDGAVYVSNVIGNDELLHVPAKEITSAAISRNGQLLAIAAGAKPIQLFSLTTRTLFKELPSSRPVYSLAFSDDAGFLVAGDQNLVANVFDISSGKLVRPVQNFSWISTLAFGHRSTIVACQKDDRVVRIFKALVNGKDIINIPQELEVGSLAFSPDDQFLAVGGSDLNSADTVAHIYRTADGSEIEMMPLVHHGAVLSIDFSQDGRFLGTGSGDNYARIVDRNHPDVRREFPHDGPVVSVVFSSDGELLATASNDGTVRVISTAGGAEIERIEAHQRDLKGLSFADEGRVLRVVSVGSDLLSQFVEVDEYPVAAGHLIATGCLLIGRNLTDEQWNKYVPEEGSRKICPD